MQEAHQTLQKDLERIVKKQKTAYSRTNATIDQIILELNKAKEELSNPSQMEVSSPEKSVSPPQPLAKLSKTIQDAQVGQKLGTELKELHNCIAKLGKNVDKYLTPDLALALKCDPKLDSKLVNLAIVQHLFKKGRFKPAQLFAESVGVPITNEMREPFLEMHTIMTQIRSGNLEPALQWARARRAELEKNPSTSIEFKLHRVRYMQILTTGSRADAIAYAQTQFPPFAAANLRQVQRLMGALAFANRIDKSPYADLYPATLLTEATNSFTKVCCAVLGFSEESPLHVALNAGCTSMPTHLKFASLLRAKSALSSSAGSDAAPSLLGQKEFQAEVDLGKQYQFHSVFTCPVSREQSTKENPPVLLHCGHVIAKVSMLKLAKGGTSRFKCPYCPMEQTVGQSTPVNF